jgi:DNA-binding XRE family transcriptional regulator
MKELRPGSRGRSEVRILFAFDPRRRAIMLTAGDKSRNWQRWYRTNIPIADERFDQHLEKAEKEENMTSLDQMKRRRPVRRGVVNAHKDRMLAETRAWRLRELRERFDLTQVQLARQLDVSQNRVSRIEQGEIDKTQVDTLRRYVEALGGSLNVEVHLGDDTFKIA